MWHAHILDTAAYHADRERAFGFYYHHLPYFGIRPADDARNLTDAYDATLRRYQEAFGQAPIGIWTHELTGKCKRTGCKPQKCK